MIEKPPADQEDILLEHTLQEAAELCGRDYGYTCTVARELGLGHDEPRRPGSKGPLRRLLWASEVAALKRHFAGKEHPEQMKKPMRRLTRLKIRTTKAGGAKVEIAYEQAPSEDADEWDEYSVCSCAAPRRELHERLAELIPLVCEDLGLPQTYAVGMRVSGITCSWTNEVMGATICVLKQLPTADSPLVLNTPHKPSEPYGEGAGGHLLSEDLVIALAEVEAEALRYVDGEREQLSLGLEFGKEETGEKPLTLRVAEAILDTVENPESTAAGDLLAELEQEAAPV